MTTVYQPQSARSLGPLWHEEWQHDARVNSEQGNIDCHAHGFHRIDNDWGLSADGVWCNGHQAPSFIWFKPGHTFRNFSWSALVVRAVNGRHLRNATTAFDACRRWNQNMEFEVKNIPRVTDAELQIAFKMLASTARHEFGPDWQRRVVVKVLTNLPDGEDYALRVCRAAHAAGFQTMLLARGKSRFRRYRGHTAVTYVRGSAVIW